MSERPRASVVVTTYNNPRYLELVLLGYARQDRADFEVVVADDGSRDETKQLIDRLRPGFPVPLVHAWQPDIGFRQSRVLNWGALHARADHLVFTDGDCIPPAHMVSRHLAAARPNTLVVGGCVRLAQEPSAAITPDQVANGAFEALLTPADRRSMWWWHVKNTWYIATGARRRPKIQGLNFSVDRAAFYAVNGFDLAYENNARQDSDLRNRLRLTSARARCIWHSCIVFHLWHKRHAGRDGWSAADAYYARRDLQPWAVRGIRELAAETGRPLHADGAAVARAGG
jgi:glycosyltransferase involved in cell wall biosynthesis